MAYEHGISILERSTSITPPITTSAGVQVVIGTAPVHLAANPRAAVNTPVLAYELGDAVKAIGYNEDFEKYTLCQSIYASFHLFKVAPVIFINVLDPDVHFEAVDAKSVSLLKGVGTIDVEGVLLDSIVVKNGGTTYNKDVDYSVAFDKDGKPVISLISGGTIPTSTTSLTVDFKKISPEKVTKEEIIGGYDAATDNYTGSELISKVFPKLGLVPGLILAPGWSHYPDVAAVLNAKGIKINGNFSCENVLDIDTKQARKYQEVAEWKSKNSYTSSRSIVCWPMVKVGDKILAKSAVAAALIAFTDAQNEDVPFVSPSNKSLPISGTVLADGTEVFLDQLQANYLNSVGVFTALNWNGWKSWGNNTGIYPSSSDPKDRFIAIRRVFDWWGNTFILTYFNKVDDPTNYRLIENIVDSENLRSNGYEARGQIAGATIEFREDLNPVTDILNGKITFIQKIGAFPPAENIVNILEFDPNKVSNALFGGA